MAWYAVLRAQVGCAVLAKVELGCVSILHASLARIGDSNIIAPDSGSLDDSGLLVPVDLEGAFVKVPNLID